MFMGFEQKKGQPKTLDGRVTVYALIDLEIGDLVTSKNPLAQMVHNGMLVAQGNYRDQNSLRDFFKAEGLSLEEGLQEFIDKMEGIESAFDPHKLREKLENLDELEDLMPTPAKVVPFHSEQDILSQEGDIFFAGRFRSIGNANLCINAFPMLYQARFREQQLNRIRDEIETIISQVEKNDPPVDHYTTPGVDIEKRLVKDFIPKMLYSHGDTNAVNEAQRQFLQFMEGYSFIEDIDAVLGLIRKTEPLTRKDSQLLELYAKKISAIQREDFSHVQLIKQQIEDLLR
jgi:hypothetical protein